MTSPDRQAISAFLKEVVGYDAEKRIAEVARQGADRGASGTPGARDGALADGEVQAWQAGAGGGPSGGGGHKGRLSGGASFTTIDLTTYTPRLRAFFHLLAKVTHKAPDDKEIIGVRLTINAKFLKLHKAFNDNCALAFPIKKELLQQLDSWQGKASALVAWGLYGSDPEKYFQNFSKDLNEAKFEVDTLQSAIISGLKTGDFTSAWTKSIVAYLSFSNITTFVNEITQALASGAGALVQGVQLSAQLAVDVVSALDGQLEARWTARVFIVALSSVIVKTTTQVASVVVGVDKKVDWGSLTVEAFYSILLKHYALYYSKNTAAALEAWLVARLGKALTPAQIKVFWREAWPAFDEAMKVAVKDIAVILHKHYHGKDMTWGQIGLKVVLDAFEKVIAKRVLSRALPKFDDKSGVWTSDGQLPRPADR